MKKILLKLALLGATLFAYSAANAQTVAVSADLKTMFNAGAATKTQVCFSLTDGNGNQLSNPRTSSGVIVPTATQCVSPDGSGHISTTVIANDQITPANSIYSVTYTFNGRVVHGDIFQFALADGTENLNTKTSLSTIPIIPAPTGDTTYARLDGGNSPFTGNETFNGNVSVGGTLGASVGNFASVNLSEIAAPSGLAGFDVLYGDSSLHRPRFINNNGAVVSVALLSDSLASFTGTLTSAQLAALVTDETGSGALVFANGGTIAPTSVTTGQIIQPAATIATWKDNTGGTRASIPSNGTSQGTLNNWNLTGGSSISGTAVSGATGSGNVVFDTSPAITTPTIARETINTGISQGSGFKHQRFGASCTTAAALGSLCDTAYTWTSAFTDASYTPVCQAGAVASGAPVIVQTKSVAAATFVITILNPTGAAGQLSSVNCIAIHD